MSAAVWQLDPDNPAFDIETTRPSEIRAMD
jgi:hypothetical protein